MNRNFLLAMLIIGTITDCLLARGFGGGLRGGGGAMPIAIGALARTGHGYIPHQRGYWASDIWGNDDDYPYYYDDASLPSLVDLTGTGFGHPGGSVPSYEAVNEEQRMAPPQANPNARINAFTNEASSLGIRVGGFSPGELGSIPTDMGMLQGGTLARGGNSAADLRVQGNSVRKNFKSYDAFDQNWYRAHPSAWSSRVRSNVWYGATWSEVSGYFGDGWDAFPYDYGTDLTYENNMVYLVGHPYATPDKYFQRAAELARIGEQAKIPADDTSNWLTLGVFEAIPPNQKSSNMLMQLAVNKDGVIRGNYYDIGDKNVQLIEGSIDKNIARSIWVVADKKGIIFDTSLYNLTRREAAILVHFGEDKNERWVLVRLQPPANAAASR